MYPAFPTPVFPHLVYVVPSHPLCFHSSPRIKRRSQVTGAFELGSAVASRAVQVPAKVPGLAALVPNSHLSLTPILLRQRSAQVAGDRVPLQQTGTNAPTPALPVVLRRLITAVRIAEGMGTQHHLCGRQSWRECFPQNGSWVLPREADVPLAVLGSRDELELSVLNPDGDVLPAADAEVGLEVVVVHMGAPAVFALGLDVDVVLGEAVLFVAEAEDFVLALARVLAAVELAGRGDGHGVVAAVGVIVESRAPFLLLGRGSWSNGVQEISCFEGDGGCGSEREEKVHRRDGERLGSHGVD